MESIVLNVVGSYLYKYIKNFSKDKLKVQLFSGVGELRNIELNTDAVQELLLMPPTFIGRMQMEEK